MNFQSCIDDFYRDGLFYKTKRNLSAQGISLKNAKIALYEKRNLVCAEYIIDTFTRTMIFVIPNNFTFPGETPTFNDEGIALINNKQRTLLESSTLTRFTVNQKVINETETQLLLEGEKKAEIPLVRKFRKYVESLTNKDIQEELLAVNIDVPEYGIIDDRLFIINKHDKIISRMMIFEKFEYRNKEYNSISIYYFGENLALMQENILCRYVLIFSNEIQTCVSLNENLNIEVDNETTLNVPLRKTNYRNYNISEVRKLFNRKSICAT